MYANVLCTAGCALVFRGCKTTSSVKQLYFGGNLETLTITIQKEIYRKRYEKFIIVHKSSLGLLGTKPSSTDSTNSRGSWPYY